MHGGNARKTPCFQVPKAKNERSVSNEGTLYCNRTLAPSSACLCNYVQHRECCWRPIGGTEVFWLGRYSECYWALPMHGCYCKSDFNPERMPHLARRSLLEM